MAFKSSVAVLCLEYKRPAPGLVFPTSICYVWRGTAPVATPLVSFFHKPVLLERNTIMNYSFTPSQAKHAQEVAMQLYKKRFFLPKGATLAKPLPFLSPIVFEEIYELEKMFDDKYHFTRLRTEAELLKLELDYGLAAPVLNDSKNVVTCNRYSSGLDFVAIVPLQSMMVAIPKRPYDIAMELIGAMYPKESGNHFASSIIKFYWRDAISYAEQVVKEAWDINCETEVSAEEKVVVVLETRFEPRSSNNDFMLGKIDGLVTYPHLASYLLFKQALVGCRLSQMGFTVCTSLRSGHISLQVMADGTVALIPNQMNGYDCKVAFATIL